MKLTREDHIKSAAGILFGRLPDGEPEKGWMAKLARAMGVSEGTVRATLKIDRHSMPFDDQLADLIMDRSIQMRHDIKALDELYLCFNPEAVAERELESAVAKAIAIIESAKSVVELVEALNDLENVETGAALDREYTVPELGEFPDVDWSDWNVTPLAADEKHVAFRDIDGRRHFYMDRAEVEADDEED